MAKRTRSGSGANEQTSSTPVRNTPVPRTTVKSQKPKEVSQEQIAKRAYEISQTGQGGSELDNWLRAERELRGNS